MSRITKLFNLLIAVLMTASLVLGGCASGQSKPGEGAAAPAAAPADAGPVTLKAFTVLGAFYGDSNEMTFWKELEKQTNVHLVFEHVSQNANERVNLLFASRDFPDIIFSGPSDDQITDAAAGGLIYELTPLIDKYSPNWKKFFTAEKFAKKVSTMPDGKIWSLPMIRMEDSNSGIRDQWMINVQWMNELSIPMPKSTDEFYNYLKALKTNAGKGTIPANVVPWCVWYNQYANGGLYELFNAFGVFSGQNYTSVDPKGKVVFSAIDPGMKEALKYVNKLYAEGLVKPEMFTDDGTAFDAKTSLAKPPVSGSYLRYFNDDLTEKVYNVLPPMTSPSNSTPMFRPQNNAVARNKFTVFKNCKYPEAAMKLADKIAEPDWSMQAMYGMYGEWLAKNADGSVTQKPAVGNEAYKNVPGNSIPFILTMDFMKNFKYDGSQQQRAVNIEKVYKAKTVPIERLYPPVVWKSEDLKRVTQLRTDLMDYTNKTYAEWIVNGGIDKGWDAFVSKIKALGCDEYIKIHQDYLDAFNKN